MNTEYIYLVSNGSSDIYSENTLTSFKNDLIPRHVKKYEVALSEIIIDAKFTNPALPNDTTQPCIICCKMTPDIIKSKFDEIDPSEKIFLQHRNYNKPFHFLKAITNASNLVVNGYKAILWTHDVRNNRFYFGLYKTKKEVIGDIDDFYLYMYEPLSKVLNANRLPQPFDTINLDGLFYDVYKIRWRENYFVIDMTESDLLKTSYKPNLLVSTSIIDNCYVNTKQAPILASFALEEDNGLVKHIELENPLFCNVKSSDMSSIEIRILDDHLNPAKLEFGRATVLKLLLREKNLSRAPIMDDIKITVASNNISDPENNPAQFKCDLSQRIQLYGNDWSVCLVSASIPNRFEIPFEDSYRSLHFRLHTKDASKLVTRSVLLPKSLIDTEHIVKRINKFFDTTEELYAFKDPMFGTLSIKSFIDVTIIMRGPLAYFLGFDHEKKDNVGFTLDFLPGEIVNFPFEVRFKEYLPHALFIYSDIVKSIEVSGKSLRLLKIIPVNEEKRVTSLINFIEFKNLDFHEISCGSLSRLNFEIRDQSGKHCAFEENSTVLLNLLIRKNAK